jgi:DNA-binding LacI/PurR family transcriptional regulator
VAWPKCNAIEDGLVRGATAARLLLERLCEPDRPFRRVALETTELVRGSCGASQP